MIKKIRFKNYKSFKEEQLLELKPLTILFGKNSSGKSAVTKLPVLIDNSFNNVVGEPYTIDRDGVQLGGEYRDIFYERIPNAELEFKLTSNSDRQLDIKIVSEFEKNAIPKIISWKLDNKFELTYNSKDETYKNNIDGKNYNCEFNGFNLDNIIDEGGSPPKESVYLSDLVFETNYIGPLRIYANEMRSFQIRSLRGIRSVGANGEDAYHILGIESLKSQSKIIESVNNWYIINFDGWGIKVNNDLQPNYSIELTRDDKKFNINLADVGQGMSQALPLIVSAFLPTQDVLTIIEQPELHIHPGAHGNLAQLFAESAINFNKKYLIETHSQNFILRIRRLIAEKKFNHQDLKIYWIDYDGISNSSTLRPIDVNEFGEVDFWPPDIFSETLDETIAIRSAQKQRKNAN